MAPLVVALICSSVAGDKLAQAKAQAGSLEFAIALGLAREALEAGDADPALTVAIHAFTGELAAALGDRELARAEFSRALTLDPKLALPGASPRIRDAFDDARKQVTGKALTVSATSERTADGSVTSTITWASDPYGLAVGARLFVEFNGRWVAVPDPKRWTCLEPCRWYAAAVDSHGNELARDGSPAQPWVVLPARSAAAPAADAPAPVSVSGSRPWYQRAGPYLTALAVVFGGLAAVFGAQFAGDQSRLAAIEMDRSMHLMSEALAVDGARRRNQALMFGALGAAGLAAVGAVFTW